MKTIHGFRLRFKGAVDYAFETQGARNAKSAEKKARQTIGNRDVISITVKGAL